MCYSLGQVLSEKESLEHEFKEFCFKRCIYDYYEEEEIERIVKNGELPKDFNEIVQMNLSDYFQYYVPKYASAFSNCQIKEGCLTIGISDYGEVTGIPYRGELSYDTVKEYLNSSYNYIRGAYKADYLKNMKMEIVEIDTCEAHLRLYDMTDEMIERIKKQKQEYHDAYFAYLNAREKWMSVFLTYTVNINQVRKEKLEEIVAYVQNYHPSNEEYILKTLKDPNFVVVPEMIDNYIEDTSNPLYWLFKFKDDTVDRYMAEKPKPPSLPKIHPAPYAFMTKLSDMRLKFLQNNADIRYYLIKIRFSGRINTKKHLEYYHTSKEIWLSRRRVVHSQYGPCCI